MDQQSLSAAEKKRLVLFAACPFRLFGWLLLFSLRCALFIGGRASSGEFRERERERAWVDKRANITRGYVCNRQPNTHSSMAFFFFLSFSSSFTFHPVIRTRPSCPRDLIFLVCVSLLSCITLSLSYTLIRLLCISFSWFWGISSKRNWVEYVQQKEETHITHSSLPI